MTALRQRQFSRADSNDLLRAAAVAAFCAAVSITFPFAAIHQHNSQHFQIPLWGHLGLLSVVTVLVFAAALALQLSFGRKAQPFLTLTFFTLGTAAWMNSVVLVGEFGFLDGSPIDWSRHRSQAVAEIVVYGLITLFVILKRGWVYQNLVFLTAMLGGLALLPALLSVDESGSSHESRYLFTRDDVVTLSRSENVVLIVLDSMQSDVFAEIVAADPEWEQTLSGFTYFANSLSPFPKTYASIPALLTGKIFDNSRPIQEYLEAAYFSESIPHQLLRHGYDVRMLPYRIQPLIAHPDLAHNVQPVSSRRDSARPTSAAEFFQVLDLVAFRLAPTQVKPWVYNGGGFRLTPLSRWFEAGDCEVTRRYSSGNDHHDLAFLDLFLSCASASQLKPSFRFYHLSGAHQPFVLDAELNHHPPSSMTREAFIEHSRGALAVLRKLLQHMKAIGTYDRYLIIVVGDHGGGELGVGVDPNALPGFSVDGDYDKDLSPRVMTSDLIAGGIPLFLIKRMGSTAPLTTSHAPVELSDVPATVFAELGLDHDQGASVFEIGQHNDRRRIHRHYRFAGWGIDYIVPLTEFIVDGHSWDPASWLLSDANLDPPAAQDDDGNYATLYSGGNGSRFLGEGWAEPTPEGIRMAGSTATLRFPGGFKKPVAPLRVTLVHRPLRSAETDKLHLNVYANDEPVGTWTIRAGRRRTSSLLPRHFVGNDPFELTFRTTPASAATDLQLHEVVVDVVPSSVYRLGDVVDFSRAGNSADFLIDGFSRQESWGTWTSGNRAVLLFGLEQQTPMLQVSLSARAFVTNELPVQTIHVYANQAKVQTWSLDKPETQQLDFVVPRDAFEGGDYLALEFRLPDAASPLTLGLSTDSRPLALGLVALRIMALEDG